MMPSHAMPSHTMPAHTGRTARGAALVVVLLGLGCATAPQGQGPREQPRVVPGEDATLIPLDAAGSPADAAESPTPPEPRNGTTARLRPPARRVTDSPRLFVEAPRDASDGLMRIHFIDVGQGDATLFELPCGTILADSGGEALGDFQSTELLSDYLDGFFEERADLERTIDLMILTHPHVDHTRGAGLLSDDFTLRRVVDNGQTRRASGSAQQNALREWAQDNGVEYLAIRNEEIELVFPESEESALPAVEPLLPIAECEASDLAVEVTFLWGGSDDESGELSNPNNHSVVFRVDFGDASALLTGDLEHAAIEDLIDKYHSSDLLDVSVFQVGHHGSHNATTVELVELVTPALAVFSAGDPARTEGRFNAFRFAHPNHKAVRILDDPSGGVLCGRTRVEVPVGIKGAFRDRPPVWELWALESALFSTGWDGHVVVSAAPDGALTVWTESQGDATGFVCP